ncbi:MAG TPA: hypothetical protein VFL58_11135 [Gaiellaceae bacterium]|nr:hypothetical protein [Gaiellaceae bacterium]
MVMAAALLVAMSGCGNGNKPKREVLKSANLLSGDLYVRVAGPTGVVDYVVNRLKASAFDTYGHGAFLPPPLRHHRREKVCSITHSIGEADSSSLQPWRGKRVRVDVYGRNKTSEAIFCQIVPLVLARGS